MSIFSSLMGGGSTSAASKGMRESYFNPYNINLGGANVFNTPGYVPNRKEWKRGMRPTPGNFGATLSPEMEALRTMLMGAAGGQLGQLGKSSGGFLGITPEMFAEFGLSNENMGQEFMDAGRGYLAEEAAMGPYDFDKFYAERLGLMRDLDAPMEEMERRGSIQSQYGKGIAASTAGQYQTEGLERALAAKDLMRHQGAFDQAMGRGDQYNQIRQMLQSAGLNFGHLGNQSVADRFNRAMGLFGAGQEAESLGAGRANSFLGGIGSIDQFLANLMQMSSNMGAQRSGANSQAFAPLIQSQMQQDQMGMDFLGQLMSQLGSGGKIPGLGGAG